MGSNIRAFLNSLGSLFYKVEVTTEHVLVYELFLLICMEEHLKGLFRITRISCHIIKLHVNKKETLWTEDQCPSSLCSPTHFLVYESWPAVVRLDRSLLESPKKFLDPYLLLVSLLYLLFETILYSNIVKNCERGWERLGSAAGIKTDDPTTSPLLERTVLEDERQRKLYSPLLTYLTT